MAITDRRGVVVDASSPASGADAPNPDMAIKAPVVAATTGTNITLSGVQAIDGVTVGNNNERVLVKDQTSQAQNGIYVAGAGAWSLAIDFAQADLAQGLLVEVAQGAINAGAIFSLSSPSGTITPGTSAIVFTSAADPICIEAVFDGGGVQLSAAAKLIQVEVPSRLTLVRYTLLANLSGSISIDIWRGTPAELPLSLSNSITGGSPPALVNQQFLQAPIPPAWQSGLTAGGLSAGDILVFPILSGSGPSEVTLSLYGTRP